MYERNELFIDGSWIPSAKDDGYEVICASTGEIIGRVPSGTIEEADRAVAAASRALPAWSETSREDRANLLERIADGIQRRSGEIGRFIAQEVGMPLKLATRVQAGTPVETFRSFAKILREYRFEEVVGNCLITREAVGVVAAITPWNFPLHQVAAKTAAALAAGCTIVVKPSDIAPLSAFVFAEAVEEAGLPAGVFNLVMGEGSTVGESLASNPRVDMVSFTGSTAVGRRILALAAPTVKRVALELGGKSASVILDDADLRTAVRGTVASCYFNSGQTCSAHTRLLVPERLYPEVAELAAEAASSFVLGNALDEGTRLGPLASARQRDRVRGFIEQGIRDGAKLVTGGLDLPPGLPNGFFVAPTIFGNVDPSSTLAQEEIFGPVLSIITYRSEDDAVAIANGTIFGLSGGVWTADEQRGCAFARRLKTGQVEINGGRHNPLAPFGGYKQSGRGREFGVAGLEEYLEMKAILLREPVSAAA
jgi:aldehyde dehydrogenase (NAD+)